MAKPDALAGAGDDGDLARESEVHGATAPARKFRLEPVEDRLGHLAPALVDGQRVPAAFELLELGDRGRVPVLLEGGAGYHIRNGVIGGPGHEQQGPTPLVRGVDRSLGVHHEVRRRGLEQWARR
jgi:hypothetical protein